MTEKPILHLNLKRKWFDMIKSGEKTTEYREIKWYWRRIFNVREQRVKIKGKHYYKHHEIIICFSNGYAKDREQFYCKLKRIDIGYGKPEWGAIPGRNYYRIELDHVITDCL